VGEYQQARALDEDTLSRCRRLLGPSHPNTLTSAYNLARDLSALGEHQQAHELSKDTLSWCQMVSSGNHLDTVTSTNVTSTNVTSTNVTSTNVESSNDLADDSQTPHGNQRARQLTEWIKSQYQP
jgi:hypothetical protein